MTLYALTPIIISNLFAKAMHYTHKKSYCNSHGFGVIILSQPIALTQSLSIHKYTDKSKPAIVRRARWLSFTAAPLRLRGLSQNPGVSIPHDFQTPYDSPTGLSVEVLTQFTQQPLSSLALRMSSLQVELHVMSEVAQTELSKNLLHIRPMNRMMIDCICYRVL